jgi:hypothetical protein
MAISRLYLIEVKDAETGVSEFVTTTGLPIKSCSQ